MNPGLVWVPYIIATKTEIISQTSSFYPNQLLSSRYSVVNIYPKEERRKKSINIILDKIKKSLYLRDFLLLIKS